MLCEEDCWRRQVIEKATVEVRWWQQGDGGKDPILRSYIWCDPQERKRGELVLRDMGYIWKDRRSWLFS